jgi:hypothetical protein
MDHCGTTKQETDPASCHPDAAAPVGDDAASGDGATSDDAGDIGDGGPTGNCDPAEYGATMFGTKGSDDDCKYDVEWTSTNICEGGNGVYFTVVAKKRTDESPLTGASPYIEAVQSCVHGAANGPVPFASVENPPGTYRMGPVVFDRPGGWVVRFHFFGDCEDSVETTPHGHAAFFVTVP